MEVYLYEFWSSVFLQILKARLLSFEFRSTFVPDNPLSMSCFKPRHISLGMDANDALLVHHGGVRWCKEGFQHHANSQ